MNSYLIILLGFHQYLCHCSQFEFHYFTENSDWWDGYVGCNDLGHKLAKINNANDNFEVYGLAAIYERHVWIGYISDARDGGWGYQDGTAMNYTNFYSSVDWQSATADECVYVSKNDGYWYMADCTEFDDYYTLFGYVCSVPTESPTAFPTISPQKDPTMIPSMSPTGSPTGIPTVIPSYEPTVSPQCDTVVHIEWNTNPSVTQGDISIEWDSDDASLEFMVSLDDYIEGATYVIDFNPYSGNTSIDEPTLCENRNATSFANKDFSDYWDVSLSPWKLDAVGNSDYLVYPPSTNYWQITSINSNKETNNCGSIVYSGAFSLATLYNVCKSKTGANSVNIFKNETTNYIEINGELYISVVAPIDLNDESMGYHILELNRQLFSISIPIISNSVTNSDSNIVSSIGEFDVTLLAIQSDANYQVSLTLYTHGSSFYLAYPKIVNIEDNNDGVGINDVWFESNFTDCVMNGDALTCQQIWKAKFDRNLGCPTDYSGKYYFEWMVMLCARIDDFSIDFTDCELTSTVLEKSIIIDYSLESCSAVVFDLEMETSTLISNNSDYVVYNSDNINSYNYFDIGQRAYVAVSSLVDGSDVEILNVSMYNAWICAVNTSYILENYDDSTQSGGCLSSSVTMEYGPYLLINSGSIESDHDGGDNYYTRFEEKLANNEAKYSFIIPYISDENVAIYIHNQIQMQLAYTVDYRRARRVLLANTYNYVSYQHSIASISLSTAHDGNRGKNGDNSGESGDDTSNDHLYAIIVVLSVFSSLLLCFGGGYIAYKCYSKQHGSNTTSETIINRISPRAKGIAGFPRLEPVPSDYHETPAQQPFAPVAGPPPLGIPGTMNINGKNDANANASSTAAEFEMVQMFQPSAPRASIVSNATVTTVASDISNVRTSCVVCGRDTAVYVTDPCGHFVLCEECMNGNSLQNMNYTCPICRTRLTKFIRTHR